MIASRVEGVDQKALREMADTLRDKHQPAVVVLGATSGAKVSLLAAVSKDLVQQYHAGKIIKEIAPLVGGGGGRATPISLRLAEKTRRDWMKPSKRCMG